MKIALFKFGGRISNGNNIPGPVGEVLFIIKMLNLGNCDVHGFTKPLKKDKPIDGCKLYDVTDPEIYNNIKENNFDACVIVNGSNNFFGGAEDEYKMRCYQIINKLNCPIFYILTDWKLAMQQIFPIIKNKPWASKYPEETLTIKRPVTYISQLYDMEVNKKIIEKQKIEVNKVEYFPFQMIPMLSGENLIKNLDRPLDILYVGSFRGGSREKKMVEYFWGLPENINIQVRGYIDKKDFKEKTIEGLRSPEFGTRIFYDKLFQELSKSKSAICIGDPIYSGAGVSTRIYEANIAGQVTFIDQEYDKNFIVYKNPTLRKFCYINDRNDLIKKINMIKENNDLRLTIAESQIKDINFNSEQFSNEFVNLIKKNI